MYALLHELIGRHGSDLYITANSPPLLRADGVTRPISETMLNAEQTRALAYSLMSECERSEFDATFELNLAIELAGAERFRINIHRQRDRVGIVARHLPSHGSGQ